MFLIGRGQCLDVAGDILIEGLGKAGAGSPLLLALRLFSLLVLYTRADRFSLFVCSGVGFLGIWFGVSCTHDEHV